MLRGRVIENWVQMVLEQSYGQILFILFFGLGFVTFITALVFWLTKTKALGPRSPRA